MSGACGRTYRIDPRVDPAACNTLRDGPAGLLVPEVQLAADPGVTVTPPAEGDCPQVWRVGVDAAWAGAAQTTAWQRAITSADGVWVTVTEAGTATIPRSGVWQLRYDARANIDIPPGDPTGGYVMGRLALNGNPIGTTEVMIVGHYNPSATSRVHMQGTAGTSTFINAAAGDAITLQAARVGQTTTAVVASNEQGRVRITALWVGPVGDTAA